MTESRSRSRIAQQGVLRSPLTVLTAALASFLVVFVLLTARVVSGHDPALRASASRSALVSRGGHTILRTTASGRVLGPASSATGGAQAAGTQPVTVVTRTSGGLADGGERDA